MQLDKARSHRRANEWEKIPVSTRVNETQILNVGLSLMVLLSLAVSIKMPPLKMLENVEAIQLKTRQLHSYLRASNLVGL